MRPALSDFNPPLMLDHVGRSLGVNDRDGRLGLDDRPPMFGRHRVVARHEHPILATAELRTEGTEQGLVFHALCEAELRSRHGTSPTSRQHRG
jgi:hypothetical protein